MRIFRESSAAVFNAYFQHSYKAEYIACHDRKVFAYTANERLYNMYIEARLTDSSEPCDIHTIISKFTEKNNHGPAKSDKSVSFPGGGDGN